MSTTKIKKLTVMLEASDMMKLKKMAKAEDVSASHVVRKLIRSAVNSVAKANV